MIKYLVVKNYQNYNRCNEDRKERKDDFKREEKAWEMFKHKMKRGSKGNRKLFYKTLKTLQGGKQGCKMQIKKMKEDILMKEKEAMEKWKEHLMDLLRENGQRYATEMERASKDRR